MPIASFVSCSKERKAIDPNAVIDPDAKKLGYVGEDGKSKRPDYNSVLTVKQVADLAAYLASVKKWENNAYS